ncbi:hypothetical protein H8N03_01230 [Ramlibacter sp. USB13]|uniref:Uncharacterized protein n=1 Tax=Ramlibacter cellulosilyticus TaxID=2764187 RepID=A0A923MM40_9BURK|nr:hypothetical protein [Ramlibacter cellulosilyticus]MBC5781545.1 hypothetical protein [Ramlibacter cellulosilyticus]
MKRLYVGLTLLLAAFFSTLDHVDRAHGLLARIGVQRWMTELAMAAGLVALFVHTTHLHRRLLFPRRGLRILLAGIVVYAVGAGVATGLLPRAMDLVPVGDPAWTDAAQKFATLSPLPFFLLAEVLLLVGAFRALTNLVPPEEFAADY